MQYIKGMDRRQSILFPQSLDEIIDADNGVRIIDLFEERIDNCRHLVLISSLTLLCSITFQHVNLSTLSFLLFTFKF
jgi:hypothetical protein